MMTMITKRYELTLALSPADIRTAQQKGACVVKGRVMFFTKEEVKESNARIRLAIENELRKQGLRFTYKQTKRTTKFSLKKIVADSIKKGSPVRVAIDYFFPYQSTATKTQKKQPFAWMTERPDIDNLTKSVLDAITDLEIYADDSQVCELAISKKRTAEPSIHIVIEQMNQPAFV